MDIASDSDALPERVILGYLILIGEDPDRRDKAESIITRLHRHRWSRADYQALWDSVLSQHQQGKPHGELSVQEAVRRATNTSLPFQFLSELTSEALAVVNIEAHVLSLISADDARGLATIYTQAAAKLNSGAAADEVAAWVQASVDEAAFSEPETSIKSFMDLAFEAAERIEARQRGEAPTAIPSGWATFDAKFHGFKRKELIVIAARPGCGKTVVGAEFAINAAKRGYGAYIASLEQPEGDLTERIMSSQTGVSYDAMLSGTAFATNLREHEKDFELICNATRYAGLPLFINDSASRISDIRRNIGRLNRELAQHSNDDTTGRIDVVVIDYSLWVRMEPGTRSMDRRLEIEAVTKGCTRIAKEFDCAVLLLTQVKREGAESMPRPEDLKESGSLEQDADLILALHRPALANPEDHDPTMQVGVIKNRRGETGIVLRDFDGAHMRTVEHHTLERDRRDDDTGGTGDIDDMPISSIIDTQGGLLQ